MEYQKIINLLDNTTNQSSKFRTRNWIKIIDESRRTYNVKNDIKFKTSMIGQVMVSIVKKKKKKHDTILSLAKSKLNSVEKIKSCKD